jgi:predicted dehydrogenase
MVKVVQRNDPDVVVTAIVDPAFDARRAEFPDVLGSATSYSGIEQMLHSGNLDGVMVGTRCDLHTPVAVEVLASNLPLFLEKPVAIDWEQFRRLSEAFSASKSPTVVGFPLRVSPLCELAARIVRSGTLGTLAQLQAVNNVPAYSIGYYMGWMRDEAQTGGLWMQKATHDFDYLLSLLGDGELAGQPTRVIAMESKQVFRGDRPAGLHCRECEIRHECVESPYLPGSARSRQTGREAASLQCAFAVDTGNHDSASALIQFESGLHVNYTQNFVTRRGAAARGATVIGHAATLSFDWYRDEVVVHHHHEARVERHSFGKGDEGHHGGDDELGRDFVNAMSGRTSSRASLAIGLESARLCLRARDAARATTSH